MNNKGEVCAGWMYNMRCVCVVNAEKRWEDIFVCEGVDGRDSLWPWQHGWRGLMPCCSGWRRPGRDKHPLINTTSN